MSLFCHILLDHQLRLLNIFKLELEVELIFQTFDSYRVFYQQITEFIDVWTFNDLNKDLIYYAKRYRNLLTQLKIDRARILQLKLVAIIVTNHNWSVLYRWFLLVIESNVRLGSATWTQTLSLWFLVIITYLVAEPNLVGFSNFNPDNSNLSSCRTQYCSKTTCPVEHAISIEYVNRVYRISVVTRPAYRIFDSFTCQLSMKFVLLQKWRIVWNLVCR